MRQIILILLFITAVCDAGAMFYGTEIILNNGPVPENAEHIQNIVKVLTTLLCIGLLFSTRTIMQTDLVSSLGLMLRFFWVLALVFSMYATFLALELLLLSGLANVEQSYFLVGITLLIGGSPVLFSLLFDEN